LPSPIVAPSMIVCALFTQDGVHGVTWVLPLTVVRVSRFVELNSKNGL
jgi:hypothetical protein